jgi:hypothetical protein
MNVSGLLAGHSVNENAVHMIGASRSLQVFPGPFPLLRPLN